MYHLTPQKARDAASNPALIPPQSRFSRFPTRPGLSNMRVARHVGPVKKSRRLPVTFLGEAALFVVVNVLLPVAAGGSRLGHVMIDPRYGLNCCWAYAVVDHHEREEPRVRAVTETTSAKPRQCDGHNRIGIVSGTRFDKPYRSGKVVVIVPRRCLAARPESAPYPAPQRG